MIKIKTRQEILLIFIFIFSFFLVFGQIFAQTSVDLQDKIKESNDEINKLEQEIEEFKQQLNIVEKEKNTLKNEIQELDLTRKKLDTDIKITDKKIDSTNLEIKKLELQINNKDEIINKGHLGLSESIRQINKIDSSSLLSRILSNDKISDVWNDLENIQRFQDEVQIHIKDLKQTKKELEKNKDETKEAQKKLKELELDLNDQKRIADENKKYKDELLKQTKNKESNYNKLLEENLAQKKIFELALEEYESQLKFILDPSSLPSSGSLKWPLDEILITQMFGVTKDSNRLYVSGTHSGVDFRASVGTKIKAMASGEVIGTGDTDITCYGASWGKWVAIKYNNGLASSYGHLSLIKVEKGQKITVGEIIGYSGNTGHSTAPHLHVTVYAAEAVEIQTRPSLACKEKIYTMPLAARNAYLDPMLYLPNPSPNMIKSGIL